MTRTLYSRNSTFMRVVSAVVALSFTLSLAGTGFAVPSVSTPDPADPAFGVEAPVPDADTPVSPDPAEVAPAPDSSIEMAPTTAEPDDGVVQDEPVQVSTDGLSGKPESEAKAGAALAGGVSVAAALSNATFQSVDWQAWRVSPPSAVGWQKSNLGLYREGDWIPIRIFVDNRSGSEDVLFPAFHTAWDYLNAGKNALAVDGARDFRFFPTTDATLPEDQPYPAGAQNISAYFSEYVDSDNQYYHVEMTTPTSDLVVPQGRYGVVYFQVHLALTQYWQTQTPARFGAKEYPGSSAQGRFITWDGSGVGDNTISVPVGTKLEPIGRIDGIKFHDLNRDGVKQSGEPGLSGWNFTLDYAGEFPFTATATSGADGVFTFTTLPAGDYSLDEELQAPWQSSTALPMTFTLARDEVRAVEVGNYVPAVTKTWSLSIDTLPMGATAFVRYSVDGGAPVTTNLTGSGPFTASVDVPHGSVISGIGFYVLYGGEEVLLGTMPDETLTANKTNSFTYDSSVGGIKFDSATEDGLSGWTIVLKRVVQSVETTYAMAVTGAGGAYSFEDVIPGTYVVYEVQQAGWLNTHAPLGTFSVGNGSQVTGKDFGNLFVASSIDIEKSGPALAHVGDVITYAILVTNTGNYTLTNVTVTDPLLGLNTNIGSLGAGESSSLTAQRTVLAGDPDPLPNTATVIGTPILGAPVMDSDSHEVDILKPSVSVVKTAAPTMAVNPANVVYTYVVTNTGEDTLYDVSLVDDKLSVPGGSIGTLAPGESVTLSAEAELVATTTNVADVRGEDELGLEVTDSDTATVAVYNPSISIVKSASTGVVLPGGAVTYTYLVTNTGDIALFNIAVDDDKLGAVGTIPALAPGASDTVEVTTNLFVDTLNVGEAEGWYGIPDTDFFGSVTDTSEASVDVVAPDVSIVKTGAPKPVVAGSTVTYTYLVTNTGDVALFDLVVTDDKLGEIGTIPSLGVGASSTLSTSTVLTETTENTGVVVGHDFYGHPVNDSDDETIEVYNPSIDITKSVDRERVVVGDSVTYTYLVTNTGDIALHDIEVTDDILGVIGMIDSLAPGASEPLTVTTVITADVTNVGTAEGHYGEPDSDFHGTVEDSDDATVDAIAPAVMIEKSAAPSPVVAGTTVVYTFVVTNTGDAPLYDLTVEDDHLGVIGTIDELAPAASETLTKSAVLTETTVNVVVVEGIDEFENPYTDDDSETVPVFNPAIDIVKTASSSVVLAGTPVTYTYLVTNTGDIALHDVAVTDDILGAVGMIDSLAPGASSTLATTTAVTADVTNVGTAEGWYGTPETDFYGSVEDSEPESVDVVAPAIGVVKTVSDPEIVLGESVTYTYVVTNTGDVELVNVTLTDDILGPVGSLTTLAVGDSATFTMTASPSEDTTNVVTAVGTDRYQHEVSATDDAFVEVGLPFNPPEPPDMAIDKSADKTKADAGETVTYTLTYENVGEDDAFDIVITDDYDERYVTVTDAGGGTVADGTITWKIAGPLSPEDGPQTITYKVRIDPDLPESVTRIDNVVRVSAPDDDNPDNDTDTWRVNIPEPFLPFTGGEFALIAFGALLAGALGVFLRRMGRQVS